MSMIRTKDMPALNFEEPGVRYLSGRMNDLEMEMESGMRENPTQMIMEMESGMTENRLKN